MKEHAYLPRDDAPELETQFILRIPEEPAKALREAIQSGSNSLKDRLSLKLEPDLRYGEVRFDHWLLHAKVVDLPTIIESLKTIDNKSFYKTADICQMVICKEEPDTPSADEESPNKAKKKDPNKVDKKYLWPHGVTPPCKNVRKRRFRKTLKKKCVEAPEIEKEVKRLLRVDNDAVHVKHEIINEDEELSSKSSVSGSQKEMAQENEETIKFENQNIENQQEKDEHLESDGEGEQPAIVQNPPRGVAEHDIFGGEVSSSDDENPNVRDIEEGSRLSADDSRISEFSIGLNPDQMVTEFSKSMFNSPKKQKKPHDKHSLQQYQDTGRDFFDQRTKQDFDDNDSSEPQMLREQVNIRIQELRRQCDDLRMQQAQKAQEISSIQNPTLRQRMQETLDNLLSQIYEKEMEIQELQNSG